MAKKQIIHITIDITMTILFLGAYAYRITGDTAHEWIGVSVFVLFIAHNLINRRWYATIFRGTYNFRRTVMTVCNILLILVMAALIITGLLQSRTVLAFLNLPGGMELRLIHTTAAYWLLPLIGVHIGLHWEMLFNTFRKMANRDSENPSPKIAARILAFAFAFFGVWSSFDRDIFSKLFLGFSFDYWPEERLAILFFICMLSIIGLYVFIAFYALKVINKLGKR